MRMLPPAFTHHGFSTLDIRIEPRSGGHYKSISELRWSDIQGLAILTGKNGSGKTHLMEILAHHFTNTLPLTTQMAELPVDVQVIGEHYKPEDIAFLPSGGRFSGGQAASFITIKQRRSAAIQSARSAGQRRHDIASAVRARRVSARLEGHNAHALDEERFTKICRDDDFLADDIDITENLTHVFMVYRFRALEAIERKSPGIDENGNRLGPAPWDVLNEALQIAGFPYEVVPPTKTPILGDYLLILQDRSSGTEISALGLSSGEKVIFQLILWLFSAGATAQFPKLLLLDEPDAYLHPSMTTEFLNVIVEVLVKRHRVRVIMTTHSPSTVALAPADCVFQLERGARSVEKIKDRPSIISALTAGLITVTAATKFCFVEDEDDVKFYECVNDILMDQGPNRDAMALRPSPSLAFIPVSIGKGRSKLGGGCSVVEKWVRKLDADPLNRTFFGIIDRDKHNKSSDRVRVIGRYSFENYLLDPLNIFCALLDYGAAPDVFGVTMKPGDEHLLRRKSTADLQLITDSVTQVMEKEASEIRCYDRVDITYTVGITIFVPSWVINTRGHDLLPIAQKAFGGSGVVTPPNLLKALRRSRLIPVELPELMASIQRAYLT